MGGVQRGGGISLKSEEKGITLQLHCSNYLELIGIT